MGESQSRYSIVERLTEKKLQLIKEKGQLDDIINHKIREYNEAIKALSDFDEDNAKEQEQKRRLLKREMERAEAEVENAKEYKGKKIESLGLQISEVEMALLRIEKVSENAGKESQS